MIRVNDLTDSVYDGLRALSSRRYLCAMWIVCETLREMYGDVMSALETSLLESTMTIVRGVVMAGVAEPHAAESAARVRGQWADIAASRKSEVTPGHWNAWIVFRDLADEIAGTGLRFEAAERIHIAATDRYRQAGVGPIYIDPDEEVEESSPMARVLGYLDHAVSGISVLSERVLQEVGWDPVRVAEVLSLGGEDPGGGG